MKRLDRIIRTDWSKSYVNYGGLNMSQATQVPRLDLNEEEISDISLATFYVFDKELAGACRFGVRPGAAYEIGSSGLFYGGCTPPDHYAGGCNPAPLRHGGCTPPDHYAGGCNPAPLRHGGCFQPAS
jgi:hypothetical protein